MAFECITYRQMVIRIRSAVPLSWLVSMSLYTCQDGTILFGEEDPNLVIKVTAILRADDFSLINEFCLYLTGRSGTSLLSRACCDVLQRVVHYGMHLLCFCKLSVVQVVTSIFMHESSTRA